MDTRSVSAPNLDGTPNTDMVLNEEKKELVKESSPKSSTTTTLQRLHEVEHDAETSAGLMNLTLSFDPSTAPKIIAKAAINAAARGAAIQGDLEQVKQFLKQSNPEVEVEADLEEIIEGFACGGHHTLLQKFMFLLEVKADPEITADEYKIIFDKTLALEGNKFNLAEMLVKLQAIKIETQNEESFEAQEIGVAITMINKVLKGLTQNIDNTFTDPITKLYHDVRYPPLHNFIVNPDLRTLYLESIREVANNKQHDKEYMENIASEITKALKEPLHYLQAANVLWFDFKEHKNLLGQSAALVGNVNLTDYLQKNCLVNADAIAKGYVLGGYTGEAEKMRTEYAISVDALAEAAILVGDWQYLQLLASAETNNINSSAYTIASLRHFNFNSSISIAEDEVKKLDYLKCQIEYTKSHMLTAVLKFHADFKAMLNAMKYSQHLQDLIIASEKMIVTYWAAAAIAMNSQPIFAEIYDIIKNMHLLVLKRWIENPKEIHSVNSNLETLKNYFADIDQKVGVYFAPSAPQVVKDLVETSKLDVIKCYLKRLHKKLFLDAVVPLFRYQENVKFNEELSAITSFAGLLAWMNGELDRLFELKLKGNPYQEFFLKIYKKMTWLLPQVGFDDSRSKKITAAEETITDDEFVATFAKLYQQDYEQATFLNPFRSGIIMQHITNKTLTKEIICEHAAKNPQNRAAKILKIITAEFNSNSAQLLEVFRTKYNQDRKLDVASGKTVNPFGMFKLQLTYTNVCEVMDYVKKHPNSRSARTLQCTM